VREREREAGREAMCSFSEGAKVVCRVVVLSSVEFVRNEKCCHSFAYLSSPSSSIKAANAFKVPPLNWYKDIHRYATKREGNLCCEEG
jgi:hypothetical protein